MSKSGQPPDLKKYMDKKLNSKCCLAIKTFSFVTCRNIILFAVEILTTCWFQSFSLQHRESECFQIYFGLHHVKLIWKEVRLSIFFCSQAQCRQERGWSVAWVWPVYESCAGQHRWDQRCRQEWDRHGGEAPSLIFWVLIDSCALYIHT